MEKVRYWGLSISVLFLALVLFFLNAAMGSSSASLPVVMLFLVSFYAASGNLSAIVLTSKIMIIIQIVVGLIILLQLQSNSQLQIYFGSPLGFYIGVVISLVIWCAIFNWASSKREHSEGVDQSDIPLPEINPTFSALDTSLNSSEEYPSAAVGQEHSSAVRTALLYRTDLEEAKAFAASKGDRLQRELFRILNESPDKPADDLLQELIAISSDAEEPFQRKEWNEFYLKLESLGEEAQAKFKEVACVLGESFDGEFAYNKILQDSCPPWKREYDRLKDLKQGVYRRNRVSFAIIEGRQVLLLERDDATVRKKYKSIEEFCRLNVDYLSTNCA